MIRFKYKNTRSIGAILCVYSTVAPVCADHTDSNAELRNLQALPFGYVVRCEGDDLKIRSHNSATFVIRHSEVCRRAANDPTRRHSSHSTTDPTTLDFILCTTDPGSVDNTTASPIPTCSTLTLSKPI